MPSDNCLEGLISQIVADPALHARWLNTFSYLEYVGFRKILKSQRQGNCISKEREEFDEIILIPGGFFEFSA